jgi:hypothetical protein
VNKGIKGKPVLELGESCVVCSKDNEFKKNLSTLASIRRKNYEVKKIPSE